ncbi:hypothetical protein ACHAXN_010284, partial [Cyclotella atomus]
KAELQAAVDACFASDHWTPSNPYDPAVCEQKKIAHGWPMNTWCFEDSITDMVGLFLGKIDFNEDISAWDVSRVEFLNAMFFYASAFNQNISGWNVSSAISTLQMFTGASSFNQDISAWNVSRVEFTDGMFYTVSAFNQPIGAWDVSRVRNMDHMFFYASTFNQPIGTWDVSSVESMEQMFYHASAFNQDLCAWRDSFPYSNAAGIFGESGCSYKIQPNSTSISPFCASTCGESSSQINSIDVSSCHCHVSLMFMYLIMLTFFM